MLSFYTGVEAVTISGDNLLKPSYFHNPLIFFNQLQNRTPHHGGNAWRSVVRVVTTVANKEFSMLVDLFLQNTLWYKKINGIFFKFSFK